jgi:hypothetical protein
LKDFAAVDEGDQVNREIFEHLNTLRRKVLVEASPDETRGFNVVATCKTALRRE